MSGPCGSTPVDSSPGPSYSSPAGSPGSAPTGSQYVRQEGPAGGAGGPERDAAYRGHGRSRSPGGSEQVGPHRQEDPLLEVYCLQVECSKP